MHVDGPAGLSRLLISGFGVPWCFRQAGGHSGPAAPKQRHGLEERGRRCGGPQVPSKNRRANPVHIPKQADCSVLPASPGPPCPAGAGRQMPGSERAWTYAPSPPSRRRRAPHEDAAGCPQPYTASSPSVPSAQLRLCVLPGWVKREGTGARRAQVNQCVCRTRRPLLQSARRAAGGRNERGAGARGAGSGQM